MKVNFVRRFPSVEEGRKPKEIYLERVPGQRYFTFYVTMSNPEIFTSSVTEARVAELIVANSSGGNALVFLDTFAEWAETEKPLTNSLVYVKDATTDPNFSGVGGMVYQYIQATGTLLPTARLAENPYSAVGDSHTHSNLEVLNGFAVFEGEEGDKVLTFEGKPIGGAFLVDPAW